MAAWEEDYIQGAAAIPNSRIALSKTILRQLPEEESLMNLATPAFTNCSFIENGAGETGGGICSLGSSSMDLTNCIFAGNEGGYEGGALYCEESVITITNCTFASNLSIYGTAIACDVYYYWGYYGNTLTIKNSIIWDGQDSIYNYDFSSISITYSDVNKSGINAWQGIGNINKDPQFADTDNGDYHLKSQGGRWNSVSKSWISDDITSPCIDAGDPSSDYKDEPEPNGQRINMGFYGGTLQASKTYNARAID